MHKESNFHTAQTLRMEGCIAANHSTVIYQHRINTSQTIVRSTFKPNLRESMVSMEKPFKLSTHTVQTTFKPNDIQKVREVFDTFATEEFCSHLTLGLTQNANESWHNTIWSLCPMNKYISPQSIRISTVIAILALNQGKLSLFGILNDLGLSPSWSVYRSIVKREY